MVVTTAGALRLLPKIERGLGTERARLGTFRGLGTERARLGTFRGFGTERARLGTFKKNLKKLSFFTQKEHPAPQEIEVLHEKFKTVRKWWILKFMLRKIVRTILLFSADHLPSWSSVANSVRLPQVNCKKK